MDQSSYLALGKHWGLPNVPAHALLMTICWSIVLPAGAIYMRYFGLTRNAVWIHAAVQLVGTCLVLVSAGLILFNSTKASAMQQISGWPVFFVVVCSLVTGIRQLYFRVSPDARPSMDSKRQGRMIHGLLGLVGIVFAYCNLPQGNHLVAPIGEKSFHPLWLLFFVTLVGWTTTALLLERRRRKQQQEWLAPADGRHQLPSAKYDSVFDVPSSSAATTLVPDRRQYQHHDPLPLPSPHHATPPTNVSSNVVNNAPSQAGITIRSSRISASTNSNSPGQPCYSWSEINDAVVTDGKMWVVSAGGQIVDIAEWITTHPGGQQVLFAAMGTSVEFDMFPTNPSPSVKLTRAEWNQVVTTRRTNVHSPMAQSKMQSMVIGRLQAPAGIFDPLEYRRYALVHKSSLSSTPQAARSTILVRFAELYPSASSAPAFLLPGHVIEIRMRVPKLQLRKLESQTGHKLSVPKSGWISRYFTPLDGNMSCFSIAVKLLPNGIMSHLLDHLDIAHAPQVQIRGPMGTPLVNPDRPLPLKSGCWDHVIFLCAGSGASPAWQYVNWAFLNREFPVVVAQASGALATGARVTVNDLTDPAAGLVSVASSMGQVEVHLASLTPWIGNAPRVSVVLVEEDLESIMGRDVMEAVAGAYPSQVSIRYRVKCEATATAAHPHATIGRATPEYIESIVTQLAAGTDGTPMVVAIGPQRFLATVNDAMDGYPDDKLMLLPPHMYLSLPYSPARPLLVEVADGAGGGMQIRRCGANGEPMWFVDE
ncbi:hypothetical protein BCR44DRAFT_90364 [Catenaria anguillulae PL171]|uniref:Cytochrome b5 heme-binding domain-containing protein n=1 Tax=Catenaria anguillulae PL171 TaxID=765915 RepID=A0A1Y2HWD8_9FUNG|nr:hypothetical protein BCR44DRAFT_90364 [Catenaria anguillulae PL171]